MNNWNLGFGLPSLAGIQHRRIVDHAKLGKGLQFIGKPFRTQGRIGVHQMEVQVGRIGVARVAEQCQHLARLHLVAELDPKAARLQVRVEGETSLAESDHPLSPAEAPDRRQCRPERQNGIGTRFGRQRTGQGTARRAGG